MVHVTLLFNNLIPKPNGIRVKYSDGNIPQATHYALLKLPFFPVEACFIHLFDTLASGSLPSLKKKLMQGVQPTSMLKDSTSSFRVKFSSKDSDSPKLPSCENLTKTVTSTKNIKKFNK